MSARYPIPDLAPGVFHREEETIRRSRFIVTLAHAPDTASAHAFVQAIRREHPDATHNCWAFAAGAPGATARVGFSDDGEPHGTAGRPMLTMLLHGGVGEVAAVVTRYFGGVKLGTGGLVRAYQGLVRIGLDTLPRRERIIPVRVEVVIDYTQVTLFQRLLPTFEAVTVAERFGVDAVFEVSLPHERLAMFEAALVEMTGGAVLTSVLDAAADDDQERACGQDATAQAAFSQHEAEGEEDKAG